MIHPALSCMYICTLFNPDLSVSSQLRLVQKCLQDVVGPSPRVLLESFTNWAELISYDRVFVMKPESVEEIQRAVYAAHACRRQVRAVGSSHSSSPLFGDRGHIHLNLSNLALENGKRVILQPLNPDRPVAVVKVAPSVTQAELDRELEVMGYAFPFGPLVSDVTVAGSIATSSHVRHIA
ncbi:L-gulonolactone oxidase-like [Lingula anatina]|uniref:L-gulonolactone oxidase-like n=1 Tax=Lingula anatina TaxID=7574 RepID=A0A2R2MMY9_LINAN|nr:L-gulonolactone oxidase-like [Lingula anatina]|eukprot:XP_023931427.1 L-gulonolactone oxidase-like [Lingula anatina]